MELPIAAKLLVLVVGGALLLVFVSMDPTSLKITKQMSILEDGTTSLATADTVTVDDYLARSQNSSWTSPACKPHFLVNDGQPIRRIFFLHMRKAGGTVIRRYLKKVCEKYNLEYQAREGKKTVERPMDNHTLYITNLREPIARAISHYKYDQRWACANLQNDSFIPTNDNLKKTLEQFVSLSGNNNKTRIKNKNKLWTCSSNCYTRWATGNYDKLSSTCSDTLRRHEIRRIQEAREMLLNYNLIIITEKLSDDDYKSQIEAMFGVSGLARQQWFPACAKQSAAANAKLPLQISNATMQRLHDCNTPDTVLYQQLTSCPDGFDIPAYNSSMFK